MEDLVFTFHTLWIILGTSYFEITGVQGFKNLLRLIM